MLDLPHTDDCPNGAACFALAGQVLAGSAGWGKGRLCMTGGPVEQTFVSADVGTRLTVDPGDPSDGAAGQLRRALDWVETLGLERSGMNEDWLKQIIAGQDRILDQLRFGGWLGLRSGAQAGHISAKIYAEAPNGLDGLIAESFGEQPTGRSLPGRMTVVGMDTDGSVELYFAARDLMPSAIGALLAPTGLADRAGEVVQLLADLTLSQSTGRLPVRDIGYSYSLNARGGVGAVTIFATALSLFGRDSIAADRLKLAAAQLCGDLSSLESALLHAPELPQGVLRCGMVGITIVESQAPVLSCGVALDPLRLM